MKLPYFKLKDAFNEARDSFSYGSGTDKLAATAKLLGKSVANVGMVAVEIGSEAVKKIPEITGEQAKKHLESNSHLMTEEQIKKAKDAIERGQIAREKRLESEKEEENKDKKERS